MDAALEKALLQVIHAVSAHFGPEAVVKGGLSLRLYGFSRATQDVDFAFQPHRRKRTFTTELIEVLNRVFDKEAVAHSNSKKLQIHGQVDGVAVIVEASAHEGFEPETMTTAAVARLVHLQPQVISVMPKSLAFAHKLEAWLDRRLARDLYDIHIYSTYLKTIPDLKVLCQRITKPAYAQRIRPQPTLSTPEEFLEFIRAQVDAIAPHELERQLRGVVDELDLPGLGEQIRATIQRMMLF